MTMNEPNPQDWEQKLKDLEADMNREVEPSPVRPFNPHENAENLLTRGALWFKNLPTPTKVFVAVVGALVTLSVLNGIVKLVASLITVVILGIVLYILYKTLLASRSG